MITQIASPGIANAYWTANFTPSSTDELMNKTNKSSVNFRFDIPLTLAFSFVTAWAEAIRCCPKWWKIANEIGQLIRALPSTLNNKAAAFNGRKRQICGHFPSPLLFRVLCNTNKPRSPTTYDFMPISNFFISSFFKHEEFKTDPSSDAIVCWAECNIILSHSYQNVLFKDWRDSKLTKGSPRHFQHLKPHITVFQKAFLAWFGVSCYKYVLKDFVFGSLLLLRMTKRKLLISSRS